MYVIRQIKTMAVQANVAIIFDEQIQRHFKPCPTTSVLRTRKPHLNKAFILNITLKANPQPLLPFASSFF